jgi:hypothetical protein
MIAYIFIVNFPDDAHKSWSFLSEREIRFVLARVNADRQDAVTEPWAWSKFLRPALDIKTWCYAMLFGMTTTVSYALAVSLISSRFVIGYHLIHLYSSSFLSFCVTVWASALGQVNVSLRHHTQPRQS